MTTFYHSISGNPIEGELLSTGSVIQKGDKYESTDGTWSENENVIGCKLQPGFAATWVRPSKVPDVLIEQET